LVAGVVAAGSVIATADPSGASPTVTPRSAAQLLVAVRNNAATAFSGQVSETANLGLPTLPGPQSSASLSWQSFLTGTHAAKVWADGADRQRVALVGELSEADVVHNGNDVWTYTSDTNTVTHSTLGRASARPTAADADSLSPAAAAARVLKAVDPSTSVTVDSARVVAHRPAYILVLRPRDHRSTVQKVTIAVDAKKFVPLRVQVFGAGPSPAFSTGFTSISYTTPAASTFRFTTPAGAKTSTDPLGLNSETRRSNHRAGHARPSGSAGATPTTKPAGAPKVLGSGWTAVVELPRSMDAQLGGRTLSELTKPVGNSGARLLHTSLINAVVLADGRTFVGAVDATLLEHLATTSH
jgi:outer membrane lipoprotein-sorting protein